MKTRRGSVGMLVTFSFGAALALTTSMSTAALGQTLPDALAAAYANNPALLSARASLRATDESVPQALANWRPDVEINGDIARSHTELSSRAEPEQTRTPRGASLGVTQPLFRGFRTEAAVDKAEIDVRAARARLWATEQDTLLAAVRAYVNVVRDQAVISLRQNNEQVLSRQLEATRDRFRVGEITRTDVSQAEARLAGATADRIQAEGDLKITRANYINVIGEKPAELKRAEALSDLPTSFEATTGRAQENHPDVMAAALDEKSTLQTVKSVQGELLPTLNLSGTLQRRFEVASNNARQNTAEVQLNLSIPLYQKGSVYSRLREAKQNAGRRRLDLEDTRRDIIESATSAWESLVTARARTKSFEAQIKANGIALEGVRREASVGSRTVLDVLDAEQELLDSRVSLVRAQRDETVAGFELKEAIGELTAQKLGLSVTIYDPVSHYREVRGKLFGATSSGELKPSEMKGQVGEK